MYDNRSTITLQHNKTLFATDATNTHPQKVDHIPNKIKAYAETYVYANQDEIEEETIVYDWNRYFIMEYTGPDFIWQRYSNVVSLAGN
jgi:hypothetical protein